MLSIRLATLTVFPQMSYWGLRAPITPATTGPTLMPEKQPQHGLWSAGKEQLICHATQDACHCSWWQKHCSFHVLFSGLPGARQEAGLPQPHRRVEVSPSFPGLPGSHHNMAQCVLPHPGCQKQFLTLRKSLRSWNFGSVRSPALEPLSASPHPLQNSSSEILSGCSPAAVSSSGSQD